MRVSGRINHVSVNARDLQESVDFYIDLLGAQPIPTPNFGLPVQWLALGRTQLHLFEGDLRPTSHHHFGVTVDDLEPVYRAAERRGAFDYDAFRNHLVEMPGDVSSCTSAIPRATSWRSIITASTGCPTSFAPWSRGCGSSIRTPKSRCARGSSCRTEVGSKPRLSARPAAPTRRRRPP
jgi:hypothetical protein